MSLQVWLPLTKDLRNQGLATITSTGTPVFKNIGKIGSKSLDLNTRINFNCAALANIQTFSIAFWAKTNQDSNITGDWMDVLGFTDVSASGSSGQLRWETCYTYGAPTRGVSAHDNATYATIQGPSGQASIKGNWNHFCITVDPLGTGRAVEYQDGVKIGDYAANGGHLTGSFWTGETNKVNGEIQDIRIYNHALSQMEVKELAKGLVLHYPLNRNGMGPDNLIPNSLTYSGWSINSLWTQSTSNGEIIWSASRTGATSNLWNRIIPPTQFNPNNYPNGITVSFDFKCDDISALDHKCICALQIYKSDGTRIGWYESKNSFIETNYVGSSTLQNGQWKRLSCYFTQVAMQVISTGSYTIADVSYTTVSFQLVKNGSISIKKIKIEEGNHVSPYSISSQDDSVTEYDCSGFCNNGTRTGTFTWTSDTPKYCVSTKFDGTTNYVQVPAMVLDMTQISFSMWAKWLAFNTWSRIFDFGEKTEGTGYDFLVANSGSNLTVAGRRSGGASLPDTTITSVATNTWYHIVVVLSNTTCNVYLNNTLVKTFTLNGTMGSAVPLNLNYLGKSNWAADKLFNGELSDFRIYATALSADDVKSLYQNSAYIDSSGNIYGAVHMEV